MKNTNIPATKAKTQPHHNDKKADIRDNLDSRKNEEFDFKGDDVTHNHKDTKEDKLKKHKH